MIGTNYLLLAVASRCSILLTLNTVSFTDKIEEGLEEAFTRQAMHEENDTYLFTHAQGGMSVDDYIWVWSAQMRARIVLAVLSY